MKTAALACLFLLLSSAAALAATAYQGKDYSGKYQCTGKDVHDGDYKAVVDLTLDKAHSSGANASYRFTMRVEGYGLYRGAAVGNGEMLAITFANEDPKTKDYGTGIAKVTVGKDGKPGFDKFYFEPDYKGGNHGTEHCIRN